MRGATIEYRYFEADEEFQSTRPMRGATHFAAKFCNT